MTQQKTSIHGLWSSRLIFILAAVGSAVGLGNIWKFPYITGEYGGGAFVLMYLVCISLVGIPIMVAEILIGRRGRQSPIHSVPAVARESGASRGWTVIGWMGALAGFLILSFYSVIAGWALAYVGYLATGDFEQQSAEFVTNQFSSLLASPWTMAGWHSLFMILCILVVARGVHRGLEQALRLMMPLLFILLLVLVGYSLTLDSFGQGFAFLFQFNWNKLSSDAILVAMGHSFFTLSLGLGAIMAYGAYMPGNVPIGRTVFWIAGIDTTVALLAGLAIFPVVFANSMAPDAGPGLLFKTLPLAFGQMPGGTFFGALFFVMVALAAWSSAISLLEPMVAWLVEADHMSRPQATVLLGLLAWLLGLGSVLSFNHWSDLTLFGKTFFDLLDFLTANILLPLGGLLIALFVGWFMREALVRDELLGNTAPTFSYRLWRFVLSYLSPLLVLAIVVDFLLKLF